MTKRALDFIYCNKIRPKDIDMYCIYYINQKSTRKKYTCNTIIFLQISIEKMYYITIYR